MSTAGQSRTLSKPSPLSRAGAVHWCDVPLDIGASTGCLALRRCMPVDQPVQAQVVIAPALGVHQQFYQPFAQWLAAHGYAVTTFDYRGHGASLHGRLRDARANLLDWAADCAAVAAQARQAAPQLPLYWVGHSVGAQLPGMSQPALPLDGLLVVASGSGYWRDNAPPTRRKVLLWWYGIAPVLTALYGCWPGKRWGLIGDLPAGVLWQWRQWCLHPEYAIGVEGEGIRRAYAAAGYPLHALSMEDDEMMSWRSLVALMEWYSQSPQSVERVRMQDVPQGRIGHFGFFRAAMEGSLWPRALAALERWQATRVTGSPSAAAAMTPSAIPTKMACSSKAMHSQPVQTELFSENPGYERTSKRA